MRLKEALLDVFFPPKCCMCRRLLEKGESGICAACRGTVPVCAEHEMLQNFPELDGVYSAAFYEGALRSSLLRYKFGCIPSYSKAYCELILSILPASVFETDIITWVPLSRKRLRQRGYDQAQLLARGIAAASGRRPEKLLNKIKNTAPQSGSGAREARKANIAGAYSMVPSADAAGKRIVIIDDIVTTGSTLSECARVLKAAGAKSVTAVTVARRRDEKVK